MSCASINRPNLLKSYITLLMKALLISLYACIHLIVSMTFIYLYSICLHYIHHERQFIHIRKNRKWELAHLGIRIANPILKMHIFLLLLHYVGKFAQEANTTATLKLHNVLKRIRKCYHMSTIRLLFCYGEGRDFMPTTTNTTVGLPSI